MYFYDERACDFAAELTPSARGELEITDLNRRYMKLGELTAHRFGRGTAWLDAGTHDSLLETGSYIKSLETRQGLKIACLEEIALNYGWLSLDEVAAIAASYGKSHYGAYLTAVAEERLVHSASQVGPAATHNLDSELSASRAIYGLDHSWPGPDIMARV